MELLQVSQCKAWCASQHFWMNYEGLWVVIIAAIALFACYAFEKAYSNDWFRIRERITEEFAMKLTDLLMLFSIMCLLGFLIYVFFFFEPRYASEALKDMMSVGYKNISQMTQAWVRY